MYIVYFSIFKVSFYPVILFKCNLSHLFIKLELINLSKTDFITSFQILFQILLSLCQFLLRREINSRRRKNFTKRKTKTKFQKNHQLLNYKI